MFLLAIASFSSLFCPPPKVKKVHEQLKALSTKKKRKSAVTPIIDMDDPLFLPSALDGTTPPSVVGKKKTKKKSSTVESATTPVVKKANKLRSTPANVAQQPVKKSSSSK